MKKHPLSSLEILEDRIAPAGLITAVYDAATGELTLTGDAAAGETVFESGGCGACHTLSAAGSSGTVGPNLDETQPSFELAVERVTLGQGGMPAFGEDLEPQQIADVAEFVSSSAGG